MTRRNHLPGPKGGKLMSALWIAIGAAIFCVFIARHYEK